MPFKYSAFTVMMPEYTIEEAAALLSKLGYDGVEWRVHGVPSAQPEVTDFWRGNKATINVETIVEQAEEIRMMTQDHGLEIVALGTYLSYRLLDDVERCMEAAKIMRCPSIRVSPPGYNGSENYNDLFEEALDGYGKVEELARDYRVRANIELHHGKMCPSAGLGYRLVSNFDPEYIGVIYDPGNMVCEGYENWQLGLEVLGPYLSHVHVKNAAWVLVGEDKGVKRWDTEMAPLKEGCVAWDEVLLALDRVGYGGWLAFEDFGPGETETKLRDDIGYLKSLEKTLGI